MSTKYEWLVVVGRRAQFKGTATIGGSGDYGFFLTAVDDATDAFGIKIWNCAPSYIVFDNQMAAADSGCRHAARQGVRRRLDRDPRKVTQVGVARRACRTTQRPGRQALR